MKKSTLTLVNYDSIERSAKEIHEAQEEYFQKLWFFRTRIGDPVAIEFQKEILKKYKDLVNHEETAIDYDHGFIAGKLSALRWVLGANWDELDT